MFTQRLDGIYSYHYDIIGTLHVQHYRTIEDYFNSHTEWYIHEVIVNSIAKHKTTPRELYWGTAYATILCNPDGSLITKDRVVGLCRKFNNNAVGFSWSALYHAKYDRGAKRNCYSGYRHIKTFHERKWSLCIDPDYNIGGRPCRNHKNLPNSWDDLYRSVHKSWKFQSHRKSQFKNCI